MNVRVAIGLFGVAGTAGLLAAQPSRSVAPDAQVLALVRLVVTDSLSGGGVQSGQLTLPADSTSKALLMASGVTVEAVPGSSPIMCPGSTTSLGALYTPPVGYHVRIRLDPLPNSASLKLSVEKRCLFIFRGRPPRGGFAESGTWEIRKVDENWRIVRTINRSIT